MFSAPIMKLLGISGLTVALGLGGTVGALAASGGGSPSQAVQTVREARSQSGPHLVPSLVSHHQQGANPANASWRGQVTSQTATAASRNEHGNEPLVSGDPHETSPTSPAHSTSSARIAVSPASGPAQTVVDVTGTGFNPVAEDVWLVFGSGSPPSRGSSVSVNSSGDLSGSITVTASDTLGANTVLAYEIYPCNTQVCEMEATAAFTVTLAGPVQYSYTGTVGNWNQVPLSHVANVTVEGLSDATLVGQITNFQTTNPYYSCLDGRTLNVWRAPKEFPGELVVHNGDQGPQCVYGTWTYVPFYAGTWQGRWTQLSHVANVTVEGLSDSHLVGQITNFQTDDPYYECLTGTSGSTGETVNVWEAPKEFPGELVVHNGDQGPQCVYGTWTFRV